MFKKVDFRAISKFPVLMENTENKRRYIILLQLVTN